ncbi:MAG: hypothetical protein J7501_07835 [Bdellovibrio sp.]|nr:hypothetical protein [Bdellovibrio sp.]
MKTILAIIFTWTSTWAQPALSRKITLDDIIYNQGVAPGQFALAFGNYQDIRLDSDLDGKIDYWFIKSGDTEVTTRFDGDAIRSVRVQKLLPNQNLRVVILKPNSKSGLEVVTDETTKAKIYNGVLDDECATAKKSSNEVAEVVANVVMSKATEITIESYLDDSCYGDIGPYSGILKDSLSAAANDGLSNKSESFHQCIQSTKVKDTFATSKDNKINLEALSTKVSIDLKTVATQKTDKPLIKCEVSDKISASQATYQAGSGITFTFPKVFNKSDQKEIIKLVRHEFLHKAGLEDEPSMKTILAMCPVVDPKELATSKENIGHAAITVRDRVDVAADKVAKDGANTKVAATQTKLSRTIASTSARGGGSDGVDMKSEIANAKAVVPSAEKLAATKTDKSPEGIQKAAQDSVATSAPVLRMANQVMGASNTQAIAAESTESDSTSSYESSSRGSGSRSTSRAESSASDAASTSSTSSSSSSDSDVASSSRSGDRYQARHGRYQSKNDNDSSSSGLRPGERIVEEIDLTKKSRSTQRAAASSQNFDQSSSGSNSQSLAPTTSRSGSRSPASVAATQASANSANTEMASAGGSGGIAASAGSTSSLNGSSSSSSSEPRRIEGGNRRPSSANRSGSTSNPSQDEVVTFVNNNDYDTVKSKLGNSRFVSNLREGNVTIMDLKGNSYGATKGDVIFVEQGRKFIRQK